MVTAAALRQPEPCVTRRMLRAWSKGSKRGEMEEGIRYGGVNLLNRRSIAENGVYCE